MRAQTEYTDVLKSIISLSIPSIAEHIMGTLMQYVDTAMVGRLGERATASVSTTTTVSWLVSSIPYAVAISALALISRANGEKNEVATKKYAGCAITLSTILGVLLMVICMVLSPCIPVWMRAEEPVRYPASEYFFIVSIFMVFRTLMYVCGSAIRATRNTRLPMTVNLCANVLNIVLNYLFIYALGMGVRGAAIASGLSYAAGGTVMFVMMRRIKVLRFTHADLLPDKTTLSEYAEIGIPAMGTNVASCLGYVLFAGMVSSMGTTTFAAHSIAVSAEELFYIPGYGLRTASSALIGNALGEGNGRKLLITERLSIALTLVLMFLGGVLLYLTAFPLMKVFTISLPVAELGAQVLRLVAFTEPFFGLMVVFEGIFYGKGKAKGIFAIETAGMWGIRLLFTFLCVNVWHLSLEAVWYCMIADNIFKAVCLMGLYLHDRRRAS